MSLPLENEVSISSHAKIILLGDHSVVYGYPSFAIPLLSLKINVSIVDSEKRTIETNGYKGDVCSLPDQYLGIKYLINYFSKDSKKGFHIHCESNIPFSKGMGSSAASALAYTRALNLFFDKKYDEDKIIDLASYAENLIHGKASGLDLATVNSNKPIMFCKGEINKFDAELGAYLVIADTGIQKNTKKAVSLVREEIGKSEKYKEYIETLGKVTIEGINAFKDKNIYILGKFFSLCQENLKNLNVSIKEIDDLVNVALDNGALGAKLSGGGLGGIVISLADNEESAKKISEALLSHGATQTWLEKI